MRNRMTLHCVTNKTFHKVSESNKILSEVNNTFYRLNFTLATKKSKSQVQSYLNSKMPKKFLVKHLW